MTGWSLLFFGGAAFFLGFNTYGAYFSTVEMPRERRWCRAMALVWGWALAMLLLCAYTAEAQPGRERPRPTKPPRQIPVRRPPVFVGRPAGTPEPTYTSTPTATGTPFPACFPTEAPICEVRR